MFPCGLNIFIGDFLLQHFILSAATLSNSFYGRLFLFAHCGRGRGAFLEYCQCVFILSRPNSWKCSCSSTGCRSLRPVCRQSLSFSSLSLSMFRLRHSGRIMGNGARRRSAASGSSAAARRTSLLTLRRIAERFRCAARSSAGVPGAVCRTCRGRAHFAPLASTFLPVRVTISLCSRWMWRSSQPCQNCLTKQLQTSPHGKPKTQRRVR